MKPNLKMTTGALARLAASIGMASLGLVFSSSPALGSPLAVTPAGSIVDSLTPYDLTTAWDFGLDRSYQVTALDFYSNGSPYVNSHQVGIWSAEAATGYPIGTLLATVTFSVGTSGTANGLYRSIAITPIVLNPGHYEVGVFVAGGTGNSDPYLFGQGSYSLLPGITFMGGHVDTSGSFKYPGGSNFVSGNFAANFEAVSAPVPEPAGAWLLLSGLAGLATSSRKRLNLASQRCRSPSGGQSVKYSVGLWSQRAPRPPMFTASKPSPQSRVQMAAAHGGQ